MSAYGSYVLETVLTLLAVSAVAFALLSGARRVGVGRPTGGLDLVGRLALDSRRSVVLVRVAEQVFVLGVSEAGVTRLGEMAAKDLPLPVPVPQSSFGAVLGRALGKRDVGGPAGSMRGPGLAEAGTKETGT